MSRTMAWMMLLASGLVDVAWAYSMKRAAGFASAGWTAVSLALLALFVYLLGKALAELPLGVGYAVWTGVGALGSVLVGTFLFGEVLGTVRLACIALIIGGIVGLKLTTA